MTQVDPNVNTQPTTAAPRDASTKAKPRRQTPVVKFPLRFHCAITIAMGDSLRRMTGGNSLLSESDIGRLALHSYLLSNDPHYHRAMGGGF
jgi:hypothetical protein